MFTYFFYNIVRLSSLKIKVNKNEIYIVLLIKNVYLDSGNVMLRLYAL